MSPYKKSKRHSTKKRPATRRSKAKAQPTKAEGVAQKEESRGPGRPPIEFTSKMRENAAAAAGYGLKDEQIAVLLGVSEATLKRHCAEELAQGRNDANAQITQTAFLMANSGQYPAMTIFWLKVRCGWKDRTIMEHQGAGGGPIKHEHGTIAEREAKLAELNARVAKRVAEKGAKVV